LKVHVVFADTCLSYPPYKKIINLEHVSCWPHPAMAGCGVPQSVAEKRLTVLVVKKIGANEGRFLW
jgi:hypothetical protein